MPRLSKFVLDQSKMKLIQKVAGFGFRHDSPPPPLTHLLDWKRKQRGTHAWQHIPPTSVSASCWINLFVFSCHDIMWMCCSSSKSTSPVCFDVVHIIFDVMAAMTWEMIHFQDFPMVHLMAQCHNCPSVNLVGSWVKRITVPITAPIFLKSLVTETRKDNIRTETFGCLPLYATQKPSDKLTSNFCHISFGNKQGPWQAEFIVCVCEIQTHTAERRERDTEEPSGGCWKADLAPFAQLDSHLRHVLLHAHFLHTSAEA